MPSEEILTSLKNAIEHGESIQTAIQILINSGYDPKEVQEASNYIGGTMSSFPESPQEIPKKIEPITSQQPQISSQNTPQQSMPQTIQQQPRGFTPLPTTTSIPQQPTQKPFPTPQEKTKEIKPSLLSRLKLKSKPQTNSQKLPLKKHSHTKEIILLIILIILIGILLATIFFRNDILAFFSK